MYTKYEVCISNSMVGGGMCTEDDANANNDANTNDNNGQCMIV